MKAEVSTMNVKAITSASKARQSERSIGTRGDPTSMDEPRNVIRELRRAWLRKLGQQVALFVGIPTTLAAIYFGILASNQYESIAVVELRTSESAGSSRAESLLTSGANSNGSGRELLATREYALSQAMLDALVGSTNILAHFEDSKWDYVSRLAMHANREQAYAYYLKKISADYDSASGTLTLRVRTFEPHMSRKIADAIISNIDSMLNDIANRMHSFALQDAESQLEHAKSRILAGRAEPSPSTVGDAERAKLEAAFAERAYEASVSTLAELRAREIGRRPILITLSKPTLPESSTYPRRATSVFTVLVFSALALGIGSLTLAAVREHAHL